MRLEGWAATPISKVLVRSRGPGGVLAVRDAGFERGIDDRKLHRLRGMILAPKVSRHPQR